MGRKELAVHFTALIMIIKFVMFNLETSIMQYLSQEIEIENASTKIPAMR